MNSAKRNLLVVGLGNPLMGDDGVGIYVIRQLAVSPLPQHVQVADCGTDVLKLMTYLEEQNLVVFIDAMDGAAQPGTIFRMNKSQLFGFNGTSKSAHMLSVIDSLKLLDKMHEAFGKAEIDFFGIQPERVARQDGLSESVQQSADKVIQIIRSAYW